MRKLGPLTKGQLGWRKRLVEILILETMDSATEPLTGWDVYMLIHYKLPHGRYSSGIVICEIMKSLSQEGYLRKVGLDGGRYTLIREDTPESV